MERELPAVSGVRVLHGVGVFSVGRRQVVLVVQRSVGSVLCVRDLVFLFRESGIHELRRECIVGREQCVIVIGELVPWRDAVVFAGLAVDDMGIRRDRVRRIGDGLDLPASKELVSRVGDGRSDIICVDGVHDVCSMHTNRSNT